MNELVNKRITNFTIRYTSKNVADRFVRPNAIHRLMVRRTSSRSRVTISLARVCHVRKRDWRNKIFICNLVMLGHGCCLLEYREQERFHTIVYTLRGNGTIYSRVLDCDSISLCLIPLLLMQLTELYLRKVSHEIVKKRKKNYAYDLVTLPDNLVHLVVCNLERTKKVKSIKSLNFVTG